MLTDSFIGVFNLCRCHTVQLGVAELGRVSDRLLGGGQLTDGGHVATEK